MSIRVLIVEDDPDNSRTLGDILAAHRHDYDSAGEMETALKLLQPGKYDYLILDMDFPVAPGRLSRRENGRILLEQIRKTNGLETLPVIVMTGRDNDESDFIVSVMKAGHGGWTDYLQKPINGDKVDKAIKDALAHREKTVVPAAAKTVLEAFSAAQREMVVYEDHVTVLGAEVWRECEHTQTRDALALLSRKGKDGFVRIRGTKLTKDVGRQATNQIGRPIADLCNRISEVLAEKGIQCGREDVIRNKAGGYHFREWMVIRVTGDWASALGITPDTPEAKGLVTAEKPLNERQQWILTQLDKGVRLKLKDVLTHFRSQCNRSTINRDLKTLRERAVIETGSDGSYVRSNVKA